VYQISRQLDNAFATFIPLQKEEKKKEKRRNSAKDHISETPELKFEM